MQSQTGVAWYLNEWGVLFVVQSSMTGQYCSYVYQLWLGSSMNGEPNERGVLLLVCISMTGQDCSYVY